MASATTQDPLDALVLLINDALVHTGKAIRASSRDSQGKLPPLLEQPKLPDILEAFHNALDDLENDLLSAKSVILRDMNELKPQHKSPDSSSSSSQLQPVEPLAKSPVPIESNPPPAPISQNGHSDAGKFGAPMPYMISDMDMPGSFAIPLPIKEGDAPLPGPVAEPRPNTIKEEGKPAIFPAPIAMMDTKSDTPQTQMAMIAGGNDVPPLTNADLNFTDMEFTLAPSNANRTQLAGAAAKGLFASNANEPFVGQASSESAHGNVLSDDATVGGLEQKAASMLGGGEASNQANTDTEKTVEVPNAAFNDVFTGDGQADGMDFDFGLEDGVSGDTFDDLMNDRDNTFDTMEHGDFDTNFFGLGADGS